MSFDFKGLRLLVVDENTDSRELLVFMFEEEGAEVIAVESVEEALKALDQYKPDVLLSEIMMSPENGYSLIRKIRCRDAARGGKIPAIAVTVAATEEDSTLALSCGFHTHLSKPIDIDQLAEVVACLSGRAQLV